MTTFSIENFGCRATDADAAAIRREMLAEGWSLTAATAGELCADVVILNTCTVTAAADAQAREAVRKIHRANPGARIVVTGCYAQRAPEELAGIEGVDLVVGNSHQTAIPGMMRRFRGGANGSKAATPGGSDFVPLGAVDSEAMSLERGPAKILTGDIFAQTTVAVGSTTLGEGDRTRPILKIQDGCDNRCAYCVIPMVRGKSRSLAPDLVLAGMRKLIEAGAREIVLSGINLGSYGRDLTPRVGLAAVVRRILQETALEQLRLSSIEPQDVTAEFVELVASSDRIARHFHVPLQSGSDRILRAMHRWYRTAHYAERVRMIRRMLPDAAIGADVIVGFPGETEEDFARTREFIEESSLTSLHVFSFSPRPGTKAEKLGGFVPAAVIRERARELRALGQHKLAKFRAAMAGQTFRALTLARGDDDWTEALTGNYLKVRVPGKHAANEWHSVTINLHVEAEGPASVALKSGATSEMLLQIKAPTKHLAGAHPPAAIAGLP
jgi:threonylcarbamoyladenosine tRNA methylthiotransferase MtaB